MSTLRRYSSHRNPDVSGGKLLPVPMSKELAAALEAEASENGRSLRDHALRILEHYFRLNVSADDIGAHREYWEKGKLREDGPRTRSRRKPGKPNSDEVNLALSDIERLSEGSA